MTGKWMKSKGTFDLFIGFASRTWISLSYMTNIRLVCFEGDNKGACVGSSGAAAYLDGTGRDEE